MSESFKCLYYFENHQMFILETRRMDLEPNADKSKVYRWLLVYKDILEIIPLTFLSMDSSAFSQERFFRQGYLSFDSQKAVFIPEASSVQHILEPVASNQIPEELDAVIRVYFKDHY